MIDYVSFSRLSMHMTENNLSIFAREALMHGLGTQELKVLSDGEDFEISFMAKHVLKYRKLKNQRLATTHRLNDPIEEVLDDYINRRKGRLKEAKRQLRKRFDGLDHAMQERVMMAFMTYGNQAERDFIYKKLLGEEFWVDDYIPLIQQWWEDSYDGGLARVIVKYCPREYLLLRFEELEQYGNYATLCIRTGITPDLNRLSPWTYLFVLKTSGGQLRFREGEELVFQCVRNYLHEEASNKPVTSIYEIPYVRRMLTYLGEMGMVEDILAIDAFDRTMNDVPRKQWKEAVIKAIEEMFGYPPFESEVKRYI